MPSSIVDRGWKFLKGHKPAHLRPGGKAIIDRPVELTAKVYTYADASVLAKAELACLEEQLAELDREIEAKRNAAMFVRERMEHLRDLLKAAVSLELARG